MEPHTLETIWFVLLGAVWVLYLVLGGTDLGVGQLVRRTDRALALRAIGPTWSANEVLLVIAVAATLGAFPGWYAAMMSGAYLPLVVLIAAAMLRHAGIELIGHATEVAVPRWERTIVVTSHVIPFVWGVIWAGALDGSLAAGGEAGLGLLSPTGVVAGLALVALTRLQGVAFLRLRVPTLRAGLPLRPTALVATGSLAVAVVLLAAQAADGVHVTAVAVVAGLAAAAGLLVAARGAWRGGDLAVLCGAAAAMAATVAGVFAVLHRTPIAGSGPHAVVLTDAAAGETTHAAMLAITVVLLPLLLAVLAYANVRFLQPPDGEPRRGLGGAVARAARGTLDQLR